MKVVHTITKGDVGGAQTHVAELAAAQVRRGDRVTIIAGTGGPAMDRARRAGVDVRIRPEITHSVHPKRDRDAVRRLADDYVDLGPDVVHGHSSKGGLLSRLAARRVGAPSVYTAHGFPFQKGAPIPQRLMSYVGEFVGGHVGEIVICLTESEADLALRSLAVPAARVRLIPNGLPDTVHRRTPSRSSTDATVRIVMVARFAPPKRQWEVIDALSALSDLDWTMVFVGDGPGMAEVQQHAATMAGQFEFAGHRDDVEELVAGCDIGLLWSGYEGMPIALLEAMRAGLACIGSDLPGVHRLFGDGGGIVAPDVAALRREVRSLLVDRRAVDELGASARKRYEAEFTMEKMVDATAAAYHDAISATNPR